MMIAGSFLGWQPTVTALAVAATLALAAGPFCLRLRRPPPPAAAWLALGVVACWLGWAWVGPVVRPVLFNPLLMVLFLAGVLVLVSPRGPLPAARPGLPGGE
jgi:hypothetical protein